jgi:hypothetical protein
MLCCSVVVLMPIQDLLLNRYIWEVTLACFGGVSMDMLKTNYANKLIIDFYYIYYLFNINR